MSPSKRGCILLPVVSFGKPIKQAIPFVTFWGFSTENSLLGDPPASGTRLLLVRKTPNDFNQSLKIQPSSSQDVRSKQTMVKKKRYDHTSSTSSNHGYNVITCLLRWSNIQESLSQSRGEHWSCMHVYLSLPQLTNCAASCRKCSNFHQAEKAVFVKAAEKKGTLWKV